MSNKSCQLGWPYVDQVVTTAIDGASARGVNNLFKVSRPVNLKMGAAPRIDHRGQIKSNNKIFQVEAPSLFNNLPPKLRDLALSKEQFESNF